jgi:transposase
MSDHNLTTRYLGLDLHKHLVVAFLIDHQGTVVLRQSFACSRHNLQHFASHHLCLGDKVVLEATANTWSVVEILKPFVAEVVVSNPLKTRAIAEVKIKTDKVDAHVLAKLLRCDFLPRVWEPPARTQRLRRLTARRASLVTDRTAVKNRIHAVLHQRLISAPVKDLFSPPGLHWLNALELDVDGRASLDSDLRLLSSLDLEIRQQEHLLAREGEADQQVKLLMTLPGVDLIVAQSLREKSSLFLTDEAVIIVSNQVNKELREWAS